MMDIVYCLNNVVVCMTFGYWLSSCLQVIEVLLYWQTFIFVYIDATVI
jgi:hypothetical protein